MTLSTAHIAEAKPGVSHPRTPVEYLGKDEMGKSTLPDARADWHQAPKQGFTFHGHRLSSLYRKPEKTALTLISGKAHPASSFPKYSHPTPAKSAALGGIA